MLAELLHHRLPGILAGSESMQQDENRLALSPRLEVNPGAIDFDELAVGSARVSGEYNPVIGAVGISKGMTSTAASVNTKITTAALQPTLRFIPRIPVVRQACA
jgi:hypothetical protein